MPYASMFHRLAAKRVDERTITGNVTIPADAASVLCFATTGANRDVTMPLVTSVVGKLWFVMNKGAAGNLVLKTSTGGTISTLTAANGLIMAVIGSTWRVFARSVDTTS